jgi:hypothetical protein
MTRSTFRPPVAMTWPLALDHRVANDSVRLLRPYPDDVTTWPSGSLFSTAKDLSTLAIALMHDGHVGGSPGCTRAIPIPSGWSRTATRSPFDTVRSRHPFAATPRILTRFWSWRRGEVQQQFMLVKGRDGRSDYLHGGLNAFRRIRR